MWSIVIVCTVLGRNKLHLCHAYRGLLRSRCLISSRTALSHSSPLRDEVAYMENILKQLTKNKEKTKQKGSDLENSVRNLHLHKKSVPTFWISIFCSTRGYVKGLELSGVIAMNASRKRK